MKKYIIGLVICCMSLCAAAQEHLSFKGIPITGSMTTFCQKLKEKGFVQVGAEGNIRLFEGDFTGRSATVGVGAADNGQDVFTVTVLFNESDNWKTLLNTYEHYKDLYIEKYGSPTQCVENKHSGADSNSLIMSDLYQGRITYACIFSAPGGLIQLSIEKYGVLDGVVMIKYEDAQNINAKRQNDLDEI